MPDIEFPQDGSDRVTDGTSALGRFLALPNRSPKLLIALLIALLAIVAYAPVSECDFVLFDDTPVVVDNPNIKHGVTFESVRWAFTTRYHDYWHPLPWLTHMVDYQLYGLVPGGHHLTNVFIHMTSAALLFLALVSLTIPTFVAAFAAALFAVHPIHVESVAWVVERKDMLLGFFWMLSLLAYANYVKRPSAGRYVLVAGAFMLALMSKPMSSTLPCVLLLLDFWPLRRIAWRMPAALTSAADEHGNKPGLCQRSWMVILLEKLPLFLLAGLSASVTYIGVERLGAIGHHIPMTLRLANIPLSYARYLGKLFCPVDLAVLYPIEHNDPSAVSVLLATLLLLVVTALVAMLVKTRPHLLVGWVWFLGTLVPVVGLVHTGFQSMADRFVYVPAIGIYVATATEAWAILCCRSRWGGLLATCGVLAAIVALCLVTRTQLQYWRNSEALFRHALAVTHNNYVAHNNLGCVYQGQAHLDSALSHYRTAVDIEPKHYDAEYNAGVSLMGLGHADSAISYLVRAVLLRPANSSAKLALGEAYERLDQFAQAERQLTKAVKLDTLAWLPYCALGDFLFRRDRYVEASRMYAKAAVLDTVDLRPRQGLGAVMYVSGHFREAAALFYGALKRGKSASLYRQLSLSLLEIEEYEPALESIAKAKQLAPRDTSVLVVRARIFAMTGQSERAIEEFHRILFFAPQSGQADCEIGGLYENAGNLDSARCYYAAAARELPDAPEVAAALRRVSHR